VTAAVIDLKRVNGAAAPDASAVQADASISI
jgi:hypothetical protein